MVNIELSRQEVSVLLGWAEDATKGRYSFGDASAGMTWEEENLLKKLKAASIAGKERK